MKKISSIILCVAMLVSNIVLVNAETFNKLGISASAATFVHNSSANAGKTGEQINQSRLIAGRGRETFLQFDVSGVDMSKVKSAHLYLAAEHGGNNTIDINYLPNNDWNKDITYNSKPDTSNESLITSLKAGAANQGSGSYSRCEADVTDYLKKSSGRMSLHITGGENAVEFASNASDYADRSPMLCISYGEATDADNRKAVESAKEALSQGLSVTAAVSDFKASNGVLVTVNWQKIYDTTIADEKGSYTNTAYLKPDGKVTRPKWYEGTKYLKAEALLSAGNAVDTAENISITMPPQTAPKFDVDNLSDYIDIGNAESEANGFECVRDNGILTNTVDGTVHTYRSLNKSGAMALTMKCDPEKTNYLTVKLWGDDTGDSMLWICDPETGTMNVSKSKQPTRTGDVDRSDWVELNCLESAPQYNGGFIYSTYMIPQVYTSGKEYVSLRLYSTGGNSDYTSTSIKNQTAPSRGIYAAYMTQNSNFAPEQFEEITGKLAETQAVTAKSESEQKNAAYTYARDAVNTFKSWQIYGAKNYPSYMEGMVTRGTDWQGKSESDADWKDKYYQSSSGMLKQNMTPLNMYEIFSVAYKNADKLNYNETEKNELLNRIVTGIDFLVRAQGSNGGFYSTNGGWIGGPERVDAGGNNLTGFGLRSVAAAMIDMCAPSSNRMNEMIDSDADGKNDMKRKTAWEQMAAKARDYLVSIDGTGHAPNQDMVNIVAALRFEKALQIMDSSLSWKAQGKTDEVEKQLDMGLGFKPSLACSSYWVSPKGLILENFGSIQGGYSGDYGTEALEEMSQLVEFAEESLDSSKAAKYKERMENAYKAIDHFMFTANSQEGSKPKLYAEGLIGYRWAHYPGSERYILDFYNAVSNKNKTALKTFDYFFKHNNLENSKSIYYAGNAHFEDNALSVLKLYLNFDEITAALKSENIGQYNYLMEDDSIDEYAWADEMARDVVVKNGEDKIYIALNWRNPLHTTKYNTATRQDQQRGMMNNLARVHHKTDKYDKYGYAEIVTEGWNVRTSGKDSWKYFTNHYAEVFMYMDYGEYKIIMNSNNLMGNETDITYPIPWEALALNGVYKDLISGKYYYFGTKAANASDGKAASVPAASTMVLYKADSSVIPTPPPSEPTATPTAKPTTMPTVSPKPEIVIGAINGDAADISIKNPTSETKSGVLIAALYDGDRLLSVSFVPEGSGKAQFENTEIEKGMTIKAFIWKSISGDSAMKPILSCVKKAV